MDNDPQQIVAERDSTKAQYDTLEKEYDEAAAKLYSTWSDADWRICFVIGGVLLDVNCRLNKLEAAIARNQARIEEEAPRYVDENEPTLADFSPYGPLKFNRYTLYAFLSLMGVVGFILLCSKIGW